MPIDREAVLIVIDAQQGMDDPRMGHRCNPQAEQNIARLLAAWRESARPVIHVKHDSVRPTSVFRPGQPGNDIKPEVQPLAGELLIAKHRNSAFMETDLELRLRRQHCHTLVLVGMATDHCVSATARMAGDLGFETFVVDDATATHDRRCHDGSVIPAEEIHRGALASLHGEFATVVTTDAVLQSL